MRPGPLRVGQDFGPRYHVQRVLGSGGMGVVYQALDRELGVEIALKVLRTPATGAKSAHALAELQRRFKTELLLARRITHRNVIRIHDIGEINGIRFISMPLVHGPDLARRLSGGALPVARALRYARQMAAGLAAVHAAGVIHRDLKPSNVMIGENDQVVLMDFGVARTSAGPQPRAIVSPHVGTAAYMAPEQVRGEAVDARTDIYAFGLILHEMLCGPKPGGLLVADVLARLKGGPPPPRQLNPRVPAALDAIVARCLKPNPAERYQTTVELAAALAGFSGRRAAVGAFIVGPWVARIAAVLVVSALAALPYWGAAGAARPLVGGAATAVSRVVDALKPTRLLAGPAEERRGPAPPEPLRRADLSPQVRMIDAPAPILPKPHDVPVLTRVTRLGDVLNLRRLLRARTVAPPARDIEEFQVCYVNGSP